MNYFNSFSKIIVGTMTSEDWGERLSKREMIELIEHCINFGITTFDHAGIYRRCVNKGDFGYELFSSIIKESMQLFGKCDIQYA